MTQTRIIRRCPDCRSENIVPLEREDRDVATMHCRDCDLKWSEPVLPLFAFRDPLERVLLKWRRPRPRMVTRHDPLTDD